jgi:hypothetical protein
VGKGINKTFKVKSDTGWAFVAVAELLNISEHELLENIMAKYVSSVQNSIRKFANHHLIFAKKYPFVELHESSIEKHIDPKH